MEANRLARCPSMKIGIDALYIEGQRAKRLASIDAEGGSDAAACGADCLDVDRTAVGPVTVGDGDNGDGIIHVGQQRCSPVIVAGAADRNDASAGALGKIHPRIDVGRKLFGERQNFLSTM